MDSPAASFGTGEDPGCLYHRLPQHKDWELQETGRDSNGKPSLWQKVQQGTCISNTYKYAAVLCVRCLI